MPGRGDVLRTGDAARASGSVCPDDAARTSDAGRRVGDGAAGGALLGIVGYTPVLDPWPLGPRLMSALAARLADLPDARVENLSWGPIHVVQRFQDGGAWRPDRLVLIGAAALCREPGRVAAFRWRGGGQPTAALQARVHEAVTGVVDVENTLMIGEHFGVWPDDCYVVEADLPADAFGRIVIAETEGRADDDALRRELGFSPAALVDALVDTAARLARSGTDAGVTLLPKRAADLVPVGGFLRTTALGAGGRR